MARTMVQMWRNRFGKSGRYGPQLLLLAALPAFCLALFMLWGEIALTVAALALPLLVLALGMAQRPLALLGHDAATGLLQRTAFDVWVTQTFETCKGTDALSAIFKVEVDEPDILIDRYGEQATETILLEIGRRLATALRNGDGASRTGDHTFAICLQPVRKLDLETCVQLAGRLQKVVETPVMVEGATVYLTASVGFCQHGKVCGKTAKAWLDAANTALRHAQAHGPAAIRAYSDEMRRRAETLFELRSEIATALEEGQIKAWFQPQICTDTGMVSGFEALARWEHPARGMISPADFLPALEQAGLLERLAEVMMRHAFTALKAWEAAGIRIPQVGVNFAGPELSNPKLVDKVMWELDRFELTPDRLAVEVLETVVASAPDDIVARNINGLSRLGCRIDLDDFGTGHASITSIRRFSVSRIKIDRSFVMKADRDPEQQRMIGAILTMAERMDVQTLAEGVETVGEHALLAQLGCNHVQGFGIARPMPLEQTFDWIAAHNAKLEDAPRILGNRLG